MIHFLNHMAFRYVVLKTNFKLFKKQKTMNKFSFWLSLSCIMIFLSYHACKKEESDDGIIEIDSIYAERDTIFTGENTIVHIVATGNNIQYQWQATAGDIINGGASVTYVAPSCTPGNNIVTCKLSNNSSETEKSITIVVM